MLGVSLALKVSVPFVVNAKRATASAYGRARALAAALSHRREIKRLYALDDRMLKDIGLTRSDVIGALSEPLFRDPSTVLVARVQKREAGARTAPSSARAERDGAIPAQRYPSRASRRSHAERGHFSAPTVSSCDG